MNKIKTKYTIFDNYDNRKLNIINGLPKKNKYFLLLELGNNNMLFDTNEILELFKNKHKNASLMFGIIIDDKIQQDIINFSIYLQI